MSLYSLYQLLLKELGHQGPWPGETKEEIIAGSILVQNTRWENVELSLANLRRELAGDFRQLTQLDKSSLQDLIRPTGFYKNKSRSLLEIFNWLAQQGFDYPQIASRYQQDLRSQLLSLFGVGQETADVLLLYIFDQPVFIADSYAQKLFSQLTGRAYTSYTGLAQALPPLAGFSLEEAQQFHILIDTFGKQYFRHKDSFQTSFLSQHHLEKL